MRSIRVPLELTVRLVAGASDVELRIEFQWLPD